MRPILIALILFGFPASLYAEPGCLDSSKFPALHKFIGTYQTDDFLNDQAVSSGLKRLVGKDLALIRKNLSVRGYIDLTGCNLVVSGNAPHGGLGENAIVSFDLTTGKVYAGIRSESSNGEIVIYSGLKTLMLFLLRSSFGSTTSRGLFPRHRMVSLQNFASAVIEAMKHNNKESRLLLTLYPFYRENGKGEEKIGPESFRYITTGLRQTFVPPLYGRDSAAQPER